ncbi:MAG: TlpA family protein disulfide reductase [Mariprofundus sp.]
MKQRLFSLLFMLLSASLLTACGSEPEQAAAKIGEKLPPFSMQSISGEIVDSQSLFAGKVVVINAWATWCPPCRKEMPDLVQLSKLLPTDKFLVIGISVDNSLDDVKAFVQEQAICFPMYWDKSGASIVTPIFKSFRFPETFILNADGVLVEKVAGAFEWASPEMIALLKTIQKTGKLPPTD